ncbi:MAG: redoxin domain-containing protein [Bacteroidales bacterium]
MKKIHLFLALFLLSVVQIGAQSNRNNSIPLIGVTAPSFTAESTNGTINFPGDFGKSWKILFSHPKDFTPVCSSELLELAYEQDDFNKLGASLIVISTDDLEQHNSWKDQLEEINYKDRSPVKIKFPLVDDISYKVSDLYGMIHSAVSIGENIRGVFFIDPDNKVRAIYYYPNEVGRNIDELKRTLVALQTTYNDRKVHTPANWIPGEDVMVPVITSEQRKNVGQEGSPFYQYSWFMTYLKSQ